MFKSMFRIREWLDMGDFYNDRLDWTELIQSKAELIIPVTELIIVEIVGIGSIEAGIDATMQKYKEINRVEMHWRIVNLP